MHTDPLNRFVSHIIVEIIIRFPEIRFDRLGPLDHRRPPLARITTNEAIKMIKSQTRGPQVKWARLAGLPIGYVMILAEPGGSKTVLLEELGNRCRIFLHDRVIAGETGRRFGNDAGMSSMVVPSGNQRGPSGAAEGRGMEVVVFQSIGSQLVKSRGRAGSAERTGCSKPDIIQQHQQNVRCTGRGTLGLREVTLGFFCPQIDLPSKRSRGDRKDL